MAKKIRNGTDVGWNFNQSAEYVLYPTELRSAKKIVMVFDDLLREEKTHVNHIMSEEDTAASIVSI